AAMTGSLSSEAVPLANPVSTQSSPITIPKAPVVQSRIVDKDLTFPTAHGKRTYSLSQILTRLRRNDEELLTVMRDGIARLANNPERERAIIADLTKAGVPAALLTGPLHPAVIDGSNVANIDASQRRARYAYLRQIRRAAWREGYFPVIIVVDASLRHQIDRADILMERVDTGDIVMAPAGSSADQLLIDEAKRLHAVLITNDRMNDWPAAKNLEKRHVELIGGTVCIGSFHRANPAWFH
ncbi:MAG TPA: hypothetical protein VHV83_08600, partial [Armatimonadota bacterium]|nr:hypothetical protein [Armatimonadota bacterium]